MAYQYVTTLPQLQAAIRILEYKQSVAFDLETTGLDPYLDEILTLTIGGESYQYIIHMSRFTPTQLKPILAIIEDPKVLKIGHNLKFDYKFLYHFFRIRMRNIWDTMIVEGNLNKGKQFFKVGLDSTVPRYVSGVDLDKSTRKEFVGASSSVLFTEEQLKYCAMDIMYLHRVMKEQRALVEKYHMIDLINLENDTVVPTCIMEYNGVYVDKTKWLALEATAKAKLARAEKVLDKLFDKHLGKTDFVKKPLKLPEGKHGQMALDMDGGYVTRSSRISYTSPVQLKPALSQILNVELQSTEEEVLRDYLPNRVIKTLLAYREFSKKISTYGSEFLRTNVHPITGRIHAEFNQIGTDSGRFSSNHPNLQNIPKTQNYRTPFCTSDPEHRSVISADYSGCELRLIAELTQEPEWIKALKEGYDLHTYVAAILWGMDYWEMITVSDSGEHKTKKQYKDFRGKAKSTNFGVAYNMGPKRLAKKITDTKEVAKDVLDRFWANFNCIKTWLDTYVNRCIKDKLVVSPLDNRRRSLEGLDPNIRPQLAHLTGICKNHPFQSGNASITKRALCLLQEGFFNHPEWEAKSLLQVHDEIVVSCKTEYEQQVHDFMEEEMVKAATYYVKTVPMLVEIAVGKWWIH